MNKQSEYVQRRLAEIHRSNTPMSLEQWQVLNLLLQDRRRELYETASTEKPENGSGRYSVTYSPDIKVDMANSDVLDMLARGLIVRRWPNCDSCFVAAKRHTDVKSAGPLENGHE